MARLGAFGIEQNLPAVEFQAQLARPHGKCRRPVFVEQVNGATSAAATITTLSASALTVTTGQTVTFSVTVKPATGTGTPTGTVTFKDGSVVLGTVTLDANGHATFKFAFSSAGTHDIEAVYNGDSAFASSNATLVETVNRPHKWWRTR